MSFRILFIGIGIFICTSSIYSQWPVIYGDTVNEVANSIFEYYDKGYLITGERYPSGFTAYGWMLKTDINGIKKWSKCYGNQQAITRFFNSVPTTEGGIINAGLYWVPSKGCSDPLIVKVNNCGEKEWCKIYNAPYCSSVCYDICLTDNGGYMALMDHWNSGEEETIWLFNLDSVGNIIWAQVYVTDTVFFSEWSHSLLKTNDSCFVITGEAYYPDPTYPNKRIIKIILIKVKQNGEVVFEVPWGMNNGVYSDGRLSTIDASINIYTAGRRARTTEPFGDSPCLFKTSVAGEPVFYKDLKETSSLGVSTTINWFQDSTLVQCMYWGSQVGIDTTGLVKTDSFGNIIKEKPMLLNYGSGSFWGSDITYNNRLILAGYVYSGTTFDAYFYKINSNLEYDSIYTTPFTYDSLCPYPIVSDTIPLDDCEVIVTIDDPNEHPEKTRLHVYPNPAKNRITFEMPHYIVRQTSGFGLTAKTYYHQWDKVRLEVFDLFGRLMLSEKIPQQEKTVELDVSSWTQGMYVARMVYMNEVVSNVRFVVK